MRLTTVSPETQQRIAVFVPVAALAISLFVVYPAWQHYNILAKQIEQNRDRLQSLKANPPSPTGAVLPAADDLPSEPPRFFGTVQSLAASSGCRLVDFNVVPPEANKEQRSVRPVRARI